MFLKKTKLIFFIIIILEENANLKLTAVRELNHRVFGGCFAAKRKSRSINGNLFAFLEVIDKIENRSESDDLRLSRG